jgi:hypothetical protein
MSKPQIQNRDSDIKLVGARQSFSPQGRAGDADWFAAALSLAAFVSLYEFKAEVLWVVLTGGVNRIREGNTLQLDARRDAAQTSSAVGDQYDLLIKYSHSLLLWTPFSIKLFCRSFLCFLSECFKLQLDLNVVIDH